MPPAGGLTESPRRLLRHLYFGDQPAHRRVGSHKLDARGFADDASPAVTADEILRAYSSAVGQCDVDAALILHEASHRSSTVDAHAQLVEPVRENPLDANLKQRESVRMPGREIAEVEHSVRETHRLRRLTLRQESIGDATHVEHFDRARV